MRGSGLSIERFIKGKAQRTKSDAKSKKKVIIHKAQRRRQYEKVKKSAAADDADAHSGSSFYDRFFTELQNGNVDEDAEKVEAHVDKKVKARVDKKVEARVDKKVEARVDKKVEQSERKHVVKPDPFFKAKRKAEITKKEHQRAREDKKKRIVVAEKKVTQRKKRHVKLVQRTATGQPVVRNHINDILSRLQAEKKKEGK